MLRRTADRSTSNPREQSHPDDEPIEPIKSDNKLARSGLRGRARASGERTLAQPSVLSPDPWQTDVACRIKGEVKRFVLTPTRLAWAALIAGVAIYGVVWAATYKSLTPQGRLFIVGSPLLSHAVLPAQFYASPIWALPGAALIGISALGVLFLVLRRR